jgi:hypothetical protein
MFRQTIIVIACLVSLLVPVSATTHAAHAATTAVSSGTYFDHMVVILMENEGYHSIIGQSCCPFQTGLAYYYSLASAYTAILHPSLPNYLAISSGDIHGVFNDCLPTTYPCNPGATCCPVPGQNTNLLDLLGPVSFKAYAADYPINSGCYTGADVGKYAGRHFPWNYYLDNTSNSTRCSWLVKANTVTSTTSPENPDVLLNDLGSSSTAANLMWLTPNNCDNSHDPCYGGYTNCQLIGCPGEADQYLSTVVPKILQSWIFQNTRAVLVVTYDEAENIDAVTNQVVTILAGPVVNHHYQSFIPQNHYSWLATVEKNWNLNCLRFDCTSIPMTEFFAVSPGIGCGNCDDDDQYAT